MEPIRSELFPTSLFFLSGFDSGNPILGIEKSQIIQRFLGSSRVLRAEFRMLQI
jgi:hypothetical protein